MAAINWRLVSLINGLSAASTANDTTDGGHFLWASSSLRRQLDCAILDLYTPAKSGKERAKCNESARVRLSLCQCERSSGDKEAHIDRQFNSIGPKVERQLLAIVCCHLHTRLCNCTHHLCAATRSCIGISI